MPASVRLPVELLSQPFAVRDAGHAGVKPGRLRTVDLVAPFHGVRRVGTLGTFDEELDSYLPVMDAEAFFCGPTAARIHELPLPLALEDSAELHVGVPNPHRAPRGRGVVGHKLVVADGEITVVDGRRVTGVERTWCDLAAFLALPDLVAAGDAVLRSGARISDVTDLALRHPGRRHRAVRIRALGMLDGRAESRRESHTRVALLEHGLTEFEPNLEVRVGGRTYRLDLAWRTKRIAIEYQGAYHHDLAQWRRDLVRRERLVAAGWVVVFVTIEDLRDPAELASRIRALAASR